MCKINTWPSKILFVNLSCFKTWMCKSDNVSGQKICSGNIEFQRGSQTSEHPCVYQKFSWLTLRSQKIHSRLFWRDREEKSSESFQKFSAEGFGLTVRFWSREIWSASSGRTGIRNLSFQQTALRVLQQLQAIIIKYSVLLHRCTQKWTKTTAVCTFLIANGEIVRLKDT